MTFSYAFPLVATRVAPRRRPSASSLLQCGLDRGPRAPACSWQEQLDAFEAQLLLAEELQRPVSVRGAGGRETRNA